MNKRLLVFLLTIATAFVITYFPHLHFISKYNEDYDVLFKMYLFHSLSSLIVYVFIELVFNKLPNQTGFAFLASVFMKIGFFILLFSNYIYREEPLGMYERVSIIIPFFAFLIIESVFSFKLLNES